MDYINLDTLERLSGLLRGQQRQHATKMGLQMVHHDILEYISRCNKYSDSPQAVTEYLGLTKGTVSQSIQLLEERGFLSRSRDDKDKRVQHLKLADLGREYVWESDSQTRALFEGINVSPAYGKIFQTILNDVLWQVQMRQDKKGFLQCASCKHNQKNSDGSFFCKLTQEDLTQDDTQKICREHEFSA